MLVVSFAIALAMPKSMSLRKPVACSDRNQTQAAVEDEQQGRVQ